MTAPHLVIFRGQTYPSLREAMRQTRLGHLKIRAEAEIIDTARTPPAPLPPAPPPVQARDIALASEGRLLTAAEEQVLGRLVQAGNAEARALLIEKNEGLVWKYARRYQLDSLTEDDLHGEGCCGLIHAVETFDPERGLKFSTYAIWWIRQAINRAIDDQLRLVRLPVHLGERTRKLARAGSDLAVALGREPTDDEVCAHLGITREHLERARQATTVASTVSMDSPQESPGGDNYTLAEIIPDPRGEAFVAVIEERDEVASTRQQAAELLALLPARHRQILELRHGFDGAGPRTLEAVGAEVGLTRERVRQIEVEAMKRLRRRARSLYATAAD
jgi:RNA polymerase sigma factor (sigma-70 family)